ncbi:MAG: hypothetical protein GIW99_12525 [Candidatus Eremiobacteraeota bacterium]|nr:hypothetical protein [Candidatus Eremiobacteraeota bacterium]MBC5828483.1 hypothetical protein [Candidatus Eremiobacteraeota bacterium]
MSRTIVNAFQMSVAVCLGFLLSPVVLSITTELQSRYFPSVGVSLK